MALLLGLGLTAWAQPDPSVRLTPQQLEQIKAIRQRYKASRQPLKAQIKARRAELVELLSAETPDRGQVNAKAREIRELSGQLQQLIVDELFELRSVLSAEQWRAYRDRLRDDMQ